MMENAEDAANMAKTGPVWWLHHGSNQVASQPDGGGLYCHPDGSLAVNLPRVPPNHGTYLYHSKDRLNTVGPHSSDQI